MIKKWSSPLVSCLILLLAQLLERGVSAADVLKVGVTAQLPPMIYKEGGNLAGVEADFSKELGEELGRPVKLVEVNWEDQIPALIEGRTDIIMSGMSITRARQIRVAFTTPYLSMGQGVLVRRENANRYILGFPARPDGTIGVMKATTGDYLVQQEFPGVKKKEFKTAAEAAKALEKKKIDLLICDLPIVWWLAGMHEAEGLVVVPILLSQEQLAWAVRKSDGELLDSANKALAKMQSDGRANAIIKRWIPLYK